MCTRLDATDGNTCGTILRCVFLKWPYQWLTLMLNLGRLCCCIPKWILRQGCKILIGFDVVQYDFRVCLPGEKKNRRKIISSHQQGSWARGYNNLLFSRINDPNVYPCVRPHSLRARGYRESSRASFAPRASSSRGSLHSSLALVVTNPWIAEHHIVWCSIT